MRAPERLSLTAGQGTAKGLKAPRLTGFGPGPRL